MQHMPKRGLDMMKPRGPKPDAVVVGITAAKEGGEEAEGGGDYPKIMPPASYAAPEDKQPGEVWDETVQLRMEPDGRLCVLKIAGIPFDEAETTAEEVEEEQEEAPMSLADAVKAHKASGAMM